MFEVGGKVYWDVVRHIGAMIEGRWRDDVMSKVNEASVNRQNKQGVFESRSEMFAFVKTVALNEVKDLKRKTAVQARLRDNSGRVKSFSVNPCPELDALMTFEIAIAHVKPENLEAVKTDLLGHTAEASAELIGISTSAFKSRLYRGRDHLEKLCGGLIQ